MKSLLGVWRHTGEWVDVPPLSSLDWKPLAEGTTLAADSLIITGARSSVVVHIPRRSLTDRFAALVADGRILGYQTADDQVEIAIEADTLFPLRLPPDAVPTGATLEARVVKVTGAAIRSTDREAIAHGYGALTAHNPPYPPRSSRTAAAPDLAPQPVHVKKGLGVRGKDLSSLPADAVRRLYLDETEGVYVDAVIPDSPAARAGLQPHDVIRQLDGKAVRNAQELLRVLEAAPSDRPVDIVVLRTIIDLRTSKAFKSQVTLGEFSGNARVVPDAAPTAQPAPPSPAGSTFPALAPASAVPSAAAPASAAP